MHPTRQRRLLSEKAIIAARVTRLNTRDDWCAAKLDTSCDTRSLSRRIFLFITPPLIFLPAVPAFGTALITEECEVYQGTRQGPQSIIKRRAPAGLFLSRITNSFLFFFFPLLEIGSAAKNCANISVRAIYRYERYYVGNLFRHADIRDRTIPSRTNKVVISLYWLFPVLPFIIQMHYIFARVVQEAALFALDHRYRN